MRTSENYERICLNKKKILLNFAFGQNVPVGEKNEGKDCNTYDSYKSHQAVVEWLSKPSINESQNI